MSRILTGVFVLSFLPIGLLFGLLSVFVCWRHQSYMKDAQTLNQRILANRTSLEFQRSRQTLDEAKQQEAAIRLAAVAHRRYQASQIASGGGHASSKVIQIVR